MSASRSSSSSSLLDLESSCNYPMAPASCKETNNLQIFLGGSCNPTTWRQNIAIPYLKMKNISYYNPQVDNWTPESVDLERMAKQNARILLFVIDKQTRSTVSLVESAYIAGVKRNMVLVIHPFEYQAVSLTETRKRSSNIIATRSKLTMTSESVNHNESTSISSASRVSSYTLISSGLRSRELSSNSVSTETRASSRMSRNTTSSAGKEIAKANEARTNEVDEKHHSGAFIKEAKATSGTIVINREVISLNEYRELSQARLILHNLIALRDIPLFSDIHQALSHISGQLFNENIGTDSHSDSPNDLRLAPNQGPQPMASVNRQMPNRSCRQSSKFQENDAVPPVMSRDVYLSLDREDQMDVKSTVISKLEKKGLSYSYTSLENFTKSGKPKGTTASTIDKLGHSSSNELDLLSKEDSIGDKDRLISHTSDINGEKCSIDGDDDQRVHSKEDFESRLAIEDEIRTIGSSRVLLFVITNKSRGLSIMVLASHFMALFRNNVVLCVQYLEEPCCIGGELLTEAAIADYNRGRVYLRDYATKSHVPVFNTIQEAVDCCSQRCR